MVVTAIDNRILEVTYRDNMRKAIFALGNDKKNNETDLVDNENGQDSYYGSISSSK